MRKHRNILGLAVEEKRILAAVVHIGSAKQVVKHTAEFILPDDLDYSDTISLAKSFHQFLRQNRLTARDTIIGLPAKWLLVQEKTFPPAAVEVMGNMVRMQFERDYSMNYDELAVDYAGEVDSKTENDLLLVATLRNKYEQIVAMCREAGLHVEAVTSSSMMLSLWTKSAKDTTQHALYLRPEYAELVTSNGSGIGALKYLALPSTVHSDSSMISQTIARELKQNRSSVQAGHSESHFDPLFVWDGTDSDTDIITALTEHAVPSLHLRNGLGDAAVRKIESLNENTRHPFIAAIALALSPTFCKAPPIDFLHSHVNPVKKSRRTKQAAWAAFLLLALLIAGAAFAWDWQKNKEDIIALTAQTEQIAGDVETARQLVDRVSYARKWYADRLSVLDCLRDITLTYPETGTIWTTNMVFREDRRGIISGQARSEQHIIDVLDKLNAHEKFSDVKLLYIRETGRNSQDVTYAIDFSYLNRS